MTQVSHRAMATEFAVLLPPHQADAVESVVLALEALDQIEARLTVYQPESEISRVNRDAGLADVEVSAETFTLLQRAVEWSRRTSGAFDITAGPLVEAWGFLARRGGKPAAEVVEQALARVGYQELVLNVPRRTVRFRKPGMAINLGGIGKGDALDAIVARLKQEGLTDFLIHGGSSSVVAVGDQTAGSHSGWAVGIAHPTKPKRRLGGIWLRDRALSTSGSGKQFFHHRGRRYGHVIDPRSGYPAGDSLALTVVMESAADADACSTGLFVGGAATASDSSPAEWMPPVITIRGGRRQEEVEIESSDGIHWIDDPSE